MKKLLLILMLNIALITPVKANDYGKTVVGHVITNIEQIDTTALLEAELQRLAHNYSIDMLNILQAYLPSILEGVAAEIRQNADKTYKCALLEGTGNDCKNENN